MLLAIDTSGPLCACALLDRRSRKIVASRSEDIGRGHAEYLMGQIEDLMVGVGFDWPDVGSVACVTGPGSFTGLRVGIATARGLALARDVPCLGVTVFEALAHHASGGIPLVVAMDARRDQIWMQKFDEAGMAQSPPAAIAVDEWSSAKPPGRFAAIGSALPLLEGDFERLGDDLSPPIDAVAYCAAMISPTESRPSPLYLRAPDAKPQARTAT